MMWELEFRRTGNVVDPWFVYTRGSLEDCLEDALEFRRGGFHDYDAVRLGLTRAEPEPEQPEPEPEPPAHVHAWFRNEAMMTWSCTDRLVCGAIVTDEELIRSGWTSSPHRGDHILGQLWAARVEREAGR